MVFIRFPSISSTISTDLQFKCHRKFSENSEKKSAHCHEWTTTIETWTWTEMKMKSQLSIDMRDAQYILGQTVSWYLSKVAATIRKDWAVIAIWEIVIIGVM